MELQELKQQQIWVCWRYEEDQNSRLTKVLYNTKGYQTGTSLEYQSQWATFEEASAAVETHNFDGVGLILVPGIGGIDIDHKAADSTLAYDVRKLMNTYEELSPSGEGIHHLFTVDVDKIPVSINSKSEKKLSSDYYSKNPHNDLEIYIGGLTNRYLTFTGNIINDLPLMDRTDEVLTFLDTYMKKELFSKTDNGSDTFDIIVTARKAKNGEKFIALFDKGDISGYGSPSEADQALCNILAFYTGGDMDQMDSLFRQSKLYHLWLAKTIRLSYKIYLRALKSLRPFFNVLFYPCLLFFLHFLQISVIVIVTELRSFGFSNFHCVFVTFHT